MYDKYQLGDWVVEPSLQRISKNGTTKKIEPQLMTVLQLLASKPGQVITKENLKETVWVDVVVTENVLTRAISSLRKLLEDNLHEPKYIETISKTGYRLVAKVRNVQTSGTHKKSLSIHFSKNPIAYITGLIILSVFGNFVLRTGPFSSPPTMSYHPVALANNTGSEYWPAISPDGKYVAFGWRGVSNDNWDIYVKAVDADTKLRLTDDPATDLRAKWSPDGSSIYFIRYESSGNTIFKKPLLGGEEIRILKAPERSYGEFDISNDEKWICFNDRQNNSGPLRIKLISLETGKSEWLSFPAEGFNGDIHPTFSSDGTKLAFIREKNAVSMFLWQIDLETRKNTQLTESPVSINGFDWSDDGSSILYGSDRSGLYKIWKLNIKHRKSALLPVGDYQMVMPRVAQSGRIVYAKMKDNVNIWSYDLSDKIAKPWYASNQLNLNPGISPEGNKACFTMKKDGRFQIWIAGADGSDPVPITRFKGQYLTAPSWSFDSEYIVFQGFENGQSDIFLVNAQGGVPLNLTKSVSDDHAPIFTRNLEILFSSNKSGEWSIWKMKMDGSGKMKIIERAYGAKLRIDAKKIYYSKKDRFGLWECGLLGEDESLMIKQFDPMNWGAFAVAKNGIYYLNDKNKRLEYFDFKTEQSNFVYKPLGRIPRLGQTIHISPDSKQILFCQIDLHDSDIMLLEEPDQTQKSELR